MKPATRLEIWVFLFSLTTKALSDEFGIPNGERLSLDTIAVLAYTRESSCFPGNCANRNGRTSLEIGNSENATTIRDADTHAIEYPPSLFFPSRAV